MLGKLGKAVFGSRNDRYIKKKHKIARVINSLEPTFEKLSDEELKAKTEEFKQRLKKNETLDQLLPEAFAAVREAAKRSLGMRHFDVQLVGGMALHDGKIAEMRTGEGKTLVATLPAYLNALTGEGVHVVTVNDYLAQRDSEWMGQLYSFLGLTTGVIISALNHEQRQQSYAADITYGTNNEFGFDYLRDNMAFSLEQKVQRGLHYAIVDEVDSILIDEARTPLIISGPTDDQTELYVHLNKLVPLLKQQEPQEEEGTEENSGDYILDEEAKQAYLTDEGHINLERLLVEHQLLAEGESLYAPNNISLMHYVKAALRAHVVFKKDIEYIVRNNEIMIVDEFTGRVMQGRRWSDGLHQAIEAKEGVPIQSDNQTLASITFQNYFRLYDKLSGMTGTADTEAFELQQIYNLEVIVIPTHRPMIRDDKGDLIFITKREKYEAVRDDIKECLSRGQPVLVGTASIEDSEFLSQILKQAKIKHEILNAKQHEREAHIIEQAGVPGAVTISTSMAGRGTDIVLGGNLEKEIAALGENASEQDIEKTREQWKQRHNHVIELGGLHVIGSERHESRRIDNQLRGRSGRQGDPGSSRFYLSLEDDLMRIFASERVAVMMQKLGMEEGEAIEHPWVTRAIENAQRKVEGRNFDIRKQLLEYDNVANDQRRVVYEQRDELMAAEEIGDTIKAIQHDVIKDLFEAHVPPQSMEEQWDIKGLEEALEANIGINVSAQAILDNDKNIDDTGLFKLILKQAREEYANKEQQAGPAVIRHFEKVAMLQVLDNAWKEHLAAMDHLRQGINLRGYAQKDPKQEFKREAFAMFQSMLENIKQEVISIVSKVQVQADEDVVAMEEEQRTDETALEYQHAEAASALEDPEQPEQQNPQPQEPQRPYVRDTQKVGRNSPCPCGSGKKYKQCHGKLS
ncbi:MAG TPA: preprotein translocase subunit SecA [Crenotrichaceae bacterium]|nr:preprotein translocase subunit SecA [Crenotrichaceae bacterium]